VGRERGAELVGVVERAQWERVGGGGGGEGDGGKLARKNEREKRKKSGSSQKGRREKTKNEREGKKKTKRVREKNYGRFRESGRKIDEEDDEISYRCRPESR